MLVDTQMTRRAREGDRLQVGQDLSGEVCPSTARAEGYPGTRATSCPLCRPVRRSSATTP
jgi:hypothetical protein